MIYKAALVICTYNRDKYLPEALESIRQQSVDPGLFEAIIVDNNSTDNTAPITQKFIRDNPSLNISYFFEGNKGLSFARNRGLQEANAEIICYVDDDAILSPGYIKTVLQFFETSPGACGAGGRVIPKYENGKEPAWMNKYLAGFIGKVDFGKEPIRFTKAMKYPAGCNMIYKKDILVKAGGFNNDLTFRSDDKYMFYKVRELSDEIYYLPDAYVHHYIDSKRLELSNFKKLFLKTGNEEKLRVKKETGTIGLFKKLLEFIFKFAASIVLFILFAIKGKSIQGKYVVISQYCTLKGFLAKSVFVR